MRRDRRLIPLWLIPLLYAVVSLVAGIVFPRFEYEHLSSYSRGLSVSSAQAFLSAVVSGTMSLTAIVFSIYFLVMQFGAAAYSKRLVLLFGRDPILFNSLGMFFATFIYALAELVYVDRNGDGKVPFFSTLFVGALLTLSIVLLALLVQRMSQLQITNVLRIVGNEGRRVIRETYALAEGDATDRKAMHQRVAQICASAPSQTLCYSGPPRAVERFDIDALVRLAQEAQAVIVIQCAVGDTVPDGARLLRVFGNGSSIPDGALMKALRLAWDRSFEQDPKYPLRLLVDTAIMALSPAVNDPTTAVQSLDQIEDLLHRLGGCRLDGGYAEDASGNLRVVFPMPTWDDYLSLAFDEIRIYGNDSLQVQRRLRAALNDLAVSLDDKERADAVGRYLLHLDDDLAQSNLDEPDRAMARRGDRQGLGVSRP